MSPLRRHLTVAGIAAAVGIVVFAALSLFSEELWRRAADGRKADSLVWLVSMTLALTALVLLVAALSIGPVLRLRGRRVGVHHPWRRSLGVATALVAWAHVGVGLTVHSTGWDVFTQFTRVTDSNLIRFTFGLGLWVGLGVALSFVPLALTSNAAMLRRLGASRWKLLQRTTYGSFLLLGLHVVLMQYQERRDVVHIALVAAVFAAVIGLQLAGFLRTRADARARAA